MNPKDIGDIQIGRSAWNGWKMDGVRLPKSCLMWLTVCLMWLTWRINPTLGAKEPIQRSSCSGSTTCELSLPTQATCCSQVLVDLHLVPLAADACVVLGDARIQFWWIPALSVDSLLDWDIFRNLTFFLDLNTYIDQFLGLVQATNVILVMLVVYSSDFSICLPEDLDIL